MHSIKWHSMNWHSRNGYSMKWRSAVIAIDMYKYVLLTKWARSAQWRYNQWENQCLFSELSFNTLTSWVDGLQSLLILCEPRWLKRLTSNFYVYYLILLWQGRDVLQSYQQLWTSVTLFGPSSSWIMQQIFQLKVTELENLASATD